MAAGLGFKTFVSGEVLTAADTNGYLMQGVLVFANASARTAAVTSPQEGQYSYLKDTNALEYYDGAAWVGQPIGDITALTAGTGISITSATGPIPTVAIDTAVTVDKTTAQTLTNKTLTSPVIGTITNTGTLTLPTSTDTLVGRATTDTLTNKTLTSPALTTPTISTLTTNGDLLYGSGSGVLARRAIGTTGQVLTVSGGLPTWATATSALTLISSTTFTAAATLNISSVFTSTYDNYRVVFQLKGSTADATVSLRMLTGTTTPDTGAVYSGSLTETTAAAATSVIGSSAQTSMSLGTLETTTGFFYGGTFDFIAPNLAVTTNALHEASVFNAAAAFVQRRGGLVVNTATQYTGFQLNASTGNLEGGTIRVYGYSNS